MVKKIGKIACFMFCVMGIDVALLSAPKIQMQLEQAGHKVDQAVQIGVPCLLEVIIENMDQILDVEIVHQSSECLVQPYGKNESIYIVNGKQTKFANWRFVITPEQKGPLIIGPAIIKDQQSVTYESEPLKLIVQDIVQPTYPKDAPFVFTLQPEHQKVYVGQKLKVLVNFCYKKSFENLAFSGSQVSHARMGLVNQNWADVTMMIGAEKYNCKQTYFEIYPEKVGPLIIPSMQVTFEPSSLMHQPTIFSLMSLLQTQEANSYPCQIEVIDLPLRDDGLSVQAIGTFKNFKLSLERNVAQVAEGVTLAMTVQGNGNLDILKAPKLTLPEGLYVYEGNATIKHIDGDIFEKKFEWIVQADEPRTYHIDVQKFHFFDTDRSKYEVLESMPLTLQVQGVAMNSSMMKQKDESKALDHQKLIKDEALTVVKSEQSQNAEPSHAQKISVLESENLQQYVWWLMIIIGSIVGIMLTVLLMRPSITQSFWMHSLRYRYDFWRYARMKDIKKLYHLFEYLSVRYGFNLQGPDLAKCFQDLHLSDETFQNWKNFVDMLLEFNFSSAKTDEDAQLLFDLAKQWFPIILSCCKLQYKRYKKS